MAAKEIDFTEERVADAYYRVSGRAQARQKFILDTDLFWKVYQSHGEWRATGVMRIPIVDELCPEAGTQWIDARLFSDGYVRGNVKARSGEIQRVSVDVSNTLGTQH